MGAGVEDFIAPHSPPLVMDTEVETRRGETGIEASVFLDWARNYSEWWATQTCGPLGGPVEAQVSLFYLFFSKNICSLSFTFLSFNF